MHIYSYHHVPFFLFTKKNSWTAWFWKWLGPICSAPSKNLMLIEYYYMPSTCLITLHVLSHLIPKTVKSGYCYYIYFSDEETDPREVKQFALGHTVSDGAWIWIRAIWFQNPAFPTAAHVIGCSCITLFNKCFLSNYYVLGVVMNPRDPEMKGVKIRPRWCGHTLISHFLCFLGRKWRRSQFTFSLSPCSLLGIHYVVYQMVGDLEGEIQ